MAVLEVEAIFANRGESHMSERMEEGFEPVFASLLSFVLVSGNCIGSELCSLTSERAREIATRPMMTLVAFASSYAEIELKKESERPSER